MKSRVNEAVRLFKEGYNCSQSVFATYADLFGIDRETALKISCGFGGGFGRMREVCGTVSGMTLLAGMANGNPDNKNQQAKKENYDLVRYMAEEFKKQNGSIVCHELLGLTKPETSSTPEARTPQYYKKRPCADLVAMAAQIVEDTLFKDQIE